MASETRLQRPNVQLWPAVIENTSDHLDRANQAVTCSTRLYLRATAVDPPPTMM